MIAIAAGFLTSEVVFRRLAQGVDGCRFYAFDMTESEVGVKTVHLVCSSLSLPMCLRFCGTPDTHPEDAAGSSSRGVSRPTPSCVMPR